MSDLVAVMYSEVYRAGEVCAILQRLHGELLIDIEDAAYVTRESDGKLKLHQTVPIVASATGAGVFKGSFWGMLIGLLFLEPFTGMVAGAALGGASGALAGKLLDYGIPDSFMKELGEKVQPGTSVLFVLFRKVSVDKVLNQVAQFGGTVIHSSLSEEAEARLQAALAEGDEPQKAA
jgi:uncharacterized membrane protein